MSLARWIFVAIWAGILVVPASAQVGRSVGLADANTISQADLLKVPHMSPEIADAILAARPFDSIAQLHELLLSHKLSAEQAAEVYAKVFVHINLNTATREEILLIPGAGKKMAREFDEYRPWRSFKQFDKEIGKYVGPDETARLAQYCFIPINLNTASDEDILSIPGVGPKLLHEFKEYRPYPSLKQFEREIGKYVDEKEVRRLARYVTVE